jgi:membrane protease YdiL (CAAX protease family)
MRRPSTRPITGAGLVLAMFGPPAIAWAFRSAPIGIVANLRAQVCLILLASAVVGIVRFGERRPVATMLGIRPDARTLSWAAVLTAIYIFVATPVMGWATHAFAISGFDVTLHRLAALPAWYRALVVVLGAPLEDLLYRGYAQERLSSLVGRTGGAAVTTLLFAFAHAPLWGLGVAALLVMPSAVGAAFYAWRRDLAALVLAHVATDLIGIVGAS